LSDLSVDLRSWHIDSKTDVKYESGSDHEVAALVSTMPGLYHKFRDKDKGKSSVFLDKCGQKSSFIGQNGTDGCPVTVPRGKYAIQVSPQKKRKNKQMRAKPRSLYDKELDKLTGNVFDGPVDLTMGGYV